MPILGKQTSHIKPVIFAFHHRICFPQQALLLKIKFEEKMLEFVMHITYCRYLQHFQGFNLKAETHLSSLGYITYCTVCSQTLLHPPNAGTRPTFCLVCMKNYCTLIFYTHGLNTFESPQNKRSELELLK